MSKIGIIYWSGTGNTALMADAITEGVRSAGGEVVKLQAGEFDGNLADYTAIAFGCPSMGMEQLEESEFEPMFAAVEGKLSGKNIALFGSYGWGDGQWMRDWCDRCTAAGAILHDPDGLICNDRPDAATLDKCAALGTALANL